MTGDDRPQLQWSKPPEWDRFEEAVVEKYGARSPYCGFVIDRAWREFDERHPAEDLAERLRVAAGLPREAGRTHTGGPLTRARTDERGEGRVWVRVGEDTKDGMAEFAHEKGVGTHEVLRAVVLWYLEGGRDGRLRRKLERAVPEAEAAFDRLEGDDTTTPTEARTVRIARRLTERHENLEITETDLEAAVREEAGADARTVEKYTELVTDRLDVREHPNQPDGLTTLYWPAHKVAELEREAEERRREAAANAADAAAVMDPDAYEVAGDGGEIDAEGADGDPDVDGNPNAADEDEDEGDGGDGDGADAGTRHAVAVILAGDADAGAVTGATAPSTVATSGEAEGSA